MHVSGFLSGGSFMGVEAFHFEWELHQHECGRGGGSRMAGAMPLGVPPSPPLKGHLLVKDLSPTLEFIPHGVGLARYMFPVAIWQERVVLPLHHWSEEAEVARCLERVCEHGCAAVLRRWDFLSILRSARDRLHQPRVWTR